MPGQSKGWMGGSPSQRLQAEPWLRVRADRWIAGSESKGGRTDRHLREYGRTGGSPYQRAWADGRIAISESTGGWTDPHLREYRRNAGTE